MHLLSEYIVRNPIPAEAHCAWPVHHTELLRKVAAEYDLLNPPYSALPGINLAKPSTGIQLTATGSFLHIAQATRDAYTVINILRIIISESRRSFDYNCPGQFTRAIWPDAP